MSILVQAKGQLRHRFWGEYSAVIVLAFDDEASARDALRTLGESWKVGKTSTRSLVGVFERTALDREKERLGGFGADVRKIDSIKYSVDYGEVFTVDVPVLPPEDRPEGWGRDFADVSGSMAQLSLLGAP